MEFALALVAAMVIGAAVYPLGERIGLRIGFNESTPWWHRVVALVFVLIAIGLVALWL